MAKDFLNEQDVAETNAADTQATSNLLKFENNLSYAMYLLSSLYASGFLHYIPLNGITIPVVCCGGEAGQGFAPDKCPVCAQLVELWKEAKVILISDSVKGKSLREETNKLRAKAVRNFIALQGDNIRTMLPDKTIVFMPNFDTDSTKVGIWSMNKSQWETFNALYPKKGQAVHKDYPFMKSSADLFNRPIIVDKRKAKKDDTYCSFFLSPFETAMDKPQVVYNPEDVDLTKSLVIDPVRAKEVITQYMGGSVTESVAADTGLVFESEKANKPITDGIVAAISTDDDFEDDLPWEEK